MFYHTIYVFANAVKVLTYLIIWYSYDRQAISSQKARSISIFHHSIRLKMLGAIQFDDQLCLGAVKINDISSQDFLP